MEADGLGLQRAPEGAVDAAVRLQLRHVLGVALARQLDRGARPVVGGRRVGERAHELELGVDNRRRRDRLEHARARRLLDVRNDVVEVIAGPRREHARRRGEADSLARILRRPGRNRGHVGVVGDLDVCRLPRHAGDEDVVRSLRNRSVRGSAGRRGDTGRERLEPSFDGGDGVVHGAVHHAAEHGAAGGRTADDDRTRGNAAPVDDGVLTRRRGCCGCGRRSGRPQGQDHDECKRRRQAESDSHDWSSSPDEMASTTRSGPSSARWAASAASLPVGASKTKKQISSSGRWMVRSKRMRVPSPVSSAATERARRSRAARPPASPRARYVSTR